MWGELQCEIEDWHIWKYQKSIENQYLCHFLPEKLNQHPPHQTDVICLLSEMASVADGETSDIVLHLTGNVYANLLSHKLISVQPLVGNWMVYSGNGSNYHRVAVPDTRTVRLGDGWDEIEIREVVKANDPDYLAEIIENLSTTLINGWDSFAFLGLEKQSGIKEKSGSDVVSSMVEVKFLSEDITNLTINKIIVSKETESYLRQDSLFFPSSDFRHVSGNLVGRWRDADVYSTNLLSSETDAIMIHRGNMQYDSPFVLVVESVGRPGPLLWWGRGAMYGMGERSLGWEGAEKSIVRLTNR